MKERVSPMRWVKAGLLALALVAGWFGGIPTARASEALVGQQSQAFTLSDQYKKDVTVRFPSAKPVVLMLGDKGGSEQIEPWVRTLFDRYGAAIDIQGIAILRGVPPPIRPIIRSQLRSRAPKSVLLDWGGNVADMFKCKSDVCNVIIIDKQGQIRHIERGPLTSDRSRAICAILDQIR